MPGTIIFKPVEAKITHETSMITNMSPYCTVTLGKQKVSGDVCQKGGASPHWDGMVELIRDKESECLVEIKDKNILLPDSVIGSFTLNLDDLEAKGTVKQWYKMSFEDQPAGEILLEAFYKPSTALKHDDIQAHFEIPRDNLEIQKESKLETQDFSSNIFQQKETSLGEESGFSSVPDKDKEVNIEINTLSQDFSGLNIPGHEKSHTQEGGFSSIADQDKKLDVIESTFSQDSSHPGPIHHEKSRAEEGGFSSISDQNKKPDLVENTFNQEISHFDPTHHVKSHVQEDGFSSIADKDKKSDLTEGTFSQDFVHSDPIHHVKSHAEEGGFSSIADQGKTVGLTESSFPSSDLTRPLLGQDEKPFTGQGGFSSIPDHSKSDQTNLNLGSNFTSTQSSDYASGFQSNTQMKDFSQL